MGIQRRHYTPEFRADAVHLVQEQGRTVANVARSLRARGPRPGRRAPPRGAAHALGRQVAWLIARHDSASVARAWFQGLNPQLDDRSVARLLREGDRDEVGPQILSAARACVSGG